MPWWSVCLGCTEEKNCPKDPSINGPSDCPLVLQCSRTLIDREQLFPQALLWHHQWNAVEWCDMKIMRQGWAEQTSVLGHTFYPSIYLNNTSNVLWMSIIRIEFVWPVGFHAFAEFGSKTFLSYSYPFLYLFYLIFCNEMQQMCNLQGKHTTASRYDLGGSHWLLHSIS